MNNPWDPAWLQRPPPKPVWEWDVFGGRIFVLNIPWEVSWFKRTRTKIFLGSRWKRL